MNVLIWIFLIILVIIVAKYNYQSFNAGAKVVGSREKSVGLKVSYDGKVVPKGIAIPHSVSTGIPKIKYPAANGKKLYTLVLVDPDSPSHLNAKFKEWRHWVVGNIPGKKLKSGFTGYGATTVSSYTHPMPPIGSGYHRYYFKLYQQPKELTFKTIDNPKAPNWRGKWKSRDFAKQYGLKKVDQCHFLVRRTGDKNKKKTSSSSSKKHKSGE